MGFEPTTSGLEAREPSAEPLTQGPPAATRTRVRIGEASPHNLPKEQEAGASTWATARMNLPFLFTLARESRELDY